MAEKLLSLVRAKGESLKNLSKPEKIYCDNPNLMHALVPRVDLSVTGGVPRYLEEVDPRVGAEENVRRLCFHADS